MEQAKATIHSILEEFRQIATSPRDLGDRFERLILTYLRVDPLYYERFADVWMWMDWPGRGRKPDTGIDLVARERATGGYCAIQCKFYQPEHYLDKSDIDSFFTASGTSEFSSRTIVSTTDRWSKHAIAACENQQIPVTKLFVKDLAESPIDWSTFSSKKPETLQLLPKKSARPHQITAVEKVMAGLKNNDRGKLIMACGTGKTFTGLKIAEEFVKSSSQKLPNHSSPKTPATVLFLVPSIALLSQTLREWTAETSVKMQSIAVCSDAKASKRKTDTEDLSTRDLAYPATTNSQEIADRSRVFCTQTDGENQCDLLVVFSTYQSLQAIADAQGKAQGKALPEFDLILCDEAHRTTGATVQGQDESYFVRIHDKTFIQGKKRL
ncbi:MAG: DEAD/DEAH box helicase family protein, partial [Geitlerinemataceae cyanobacterium]